jgi:arylsulfatase A-like enzyme
MALVMASAALAQTDRANIVIILADDLGWRDVGYHDSEIRTPRLDALARAGVELDHFYAFPSCSPTRASLMTGQSAVRHGIYQPISKNMKTGLPLEARIMPQYFKEAGYQTLMVGKWHLGHASKDLFPTSRGFDHHYGSLTGGIGYWDHVHGGGYDWQRNGQTLREEGYVTDLLTDEAVKLIETREQGQPFLLYVAFTAPHLPNEAPEETIAGYDNIEDVHRRRHAAMVTELDASVGRIVDALDANGFAENTIVWFMSDNGGINPASTTGNPYDFARWMASWYGRPLPSRTLEFIRQNAEEGGSDNTPFRKGKMTVYEGGARVPAFIYWPSRLDPKKLDARVTIQDVLPTLAALTGLEGFAHGEMDGVDRWPVIAEDAQNAAPDFFIHGLSGDAYYEGDWKLIAPDDGDRELYNLAADPLEATNLINEQPEIASALGAKLDAFPRGANNHPSLASVFWDPDEFGGDEYREPWADAAR